MKKTINLNGHEIEYTLAINSSLRARNMRITVHADGTCTVTKSFGDEQSFMKQKAKWILDTLAKARNRIERQKKQREKWQKAGLLHDIKYDRDGAGSAMDYKMHKNKALEIAIQKIEHFNKIYGFKIASISIKNQKTRWGSCSAKGRLNFSYKIAFLPQDLADYLVVHELCHLGELNHSKNFWNLVARAIPDYQIKRKQLKIIDLKKI